MAMSDKYRGKLRSLWWKIYWRYKILKSYDGKAWI